MTIPGVRSSIEGDFYVLLVGWKPIAEQGATFKIYWNPLVNFLWWGGLVFLLGISVAAWPESDPEATAERSLGRFAPAGVSSP
jgi:cytochrome c-type biogenesis protein CcmF